MSNDKKRIRELEEDYADLKEVQTADYNHAVRNAKQIRELEAEIQVYKNCSKDHKEKCPDVKCWVQKLRDEQMDEIEQQTERIRELEREISKRPAKPLYGEARSSLLKAMDNSPNVDSAIEKYNYLIKRIEELKAEVKRNSKAN